MPTPFLGSKDVCIRHGLCGFITAASQLATERENGRLLWSVAAGKGRLDLSDIVIIRSGYSRVQTDQDVRRIKGVVTVTRNAAAH
jgi:hypothetical protein